MSDLSKLKRLLKLIITLSISVFVIITALSFVLSFLVSFYFSFMVLLGVILAFVVFKAFNPKYSRLREKILKDTMDKNNPYNLTFKYHRQDEYYDQEGLESLDKLGLIKYSEYFRFMSFIEGEIDNAKVLSFNISFSYKQKRNERNIFTQNSKDPKAIVVFRIYKIEMPKEIKNNLKLSDIKNKLVTKSKYRKAFIDQNVLYLAIGQNKAKENKLINFEPISFNNAKELEERFKEEYKIFDELISKLN